MFKIIAFIFFLCAQFILVRHDLALIDWEWWVLTLYFLLGNILWGFDKYV